MPKTCRTDTFISGKPTGSLTWLMAAVVINPPRSRAFPKPDLLNGCGWVLLANLAESNGWQKPAAQSKYHCFIFEIGPELDFWRAALRITPYFLPGTRATGSEAHDGAALSTPMASC